MRCKKCILGLTGPTGGGKSTVARFLQCTKSRVLWLDADKIAHYVMATPPVRDEILAAFGTSDRKRLADIVFVDAEKRTLLESIVHPAVCTAIADEIRNADADLLVIDAVLLEEAGLNKLCDAVWLVTAPNGMRRARIIGRDALDDIAADARLANQRDYDGKYAAVLVNDGDEDELHRQIMAILAVDEFENTIPTKRSIGFAKGEEIPDSFFEPLPEEELKLWGL